MCRTQYVEGDKMILLLREAIKRKGMDEYQFFTMCYYWRFKKQIDTWGDVLKFKLEDEIPQYVRDWLKFHYEI
jgi:hypothetical protein